MNQSNHFPGKLLDRIQRRFVRSRPGSVLILVVALLVLMALIGTAYMTMAQFDQISSAQHGFNTEVDLLLDGVTNQVEGTVTSDLYTNSQYRTAIPSSVSTVTTNVNTYNEPNEYTYYNGPGLDVGSITPLAGASPALITTPMNAGDWWLASRTPDYEANLVPTRLKTTANATIPAWAYITAPINGNQYFDTPYWPASTQIQYTSHNSLSPALGSTVVSNLMLPSSVTITAQAGASPLPAFTVAPKTGGSATPILAADADGDGIADSGLVKILTLDGITYYAAVRIIDNCAAINASIATRPNFASAPSGAAPLTYIPGDFSPVNEDLEGLLISPTTELYGSTGLLNWRFNNYTLSSQAIDETGNARTDFYWMTYPYSTVGVNLAFDQQWAQLGRRLDNPGNIIPGSPTTSNNLFQSLPITESMTLARKFCICNPNVKANPSTSSSILEQKMPMTLLYQSPTTPYAASDPQLTSPQGGNWILNFVFNPTGANTTYGPNGTGVPGRAIIVARNPVSNFAPAKFAAATRASYRFGDIVTDTYQHQYVCINPGTTAAPISPATDPYFSDPNWAFEPWTTSQTKTSINTATFQQLYAAFWAVMADQYVNVNGVAQWEPAFYSAIPVSNTVNRMFRSPTRSTSTTYVLTPQQVMYLRAALAAVNTMDLRDSDDDVTSRTIVIPDATGKPVYQANVYGAEKQPYITQVYAINDATPANDWVGIELFNPYNTPIVMTNWQFATLNRTAMPMTMTTLAPIPITTIPAQGRVVFVSSASQTNVTMPTGATLVTINTLSTMGFGKEVVILKPRRADGVLLTSTTANNVYAEGTGTTVANIDDMIPVDSYDFSNLPQAAATETATQQWIYIRPSAPTAKNWHFVYPGPWNLSAGTTLPTLGGTAYLTPAPATMIATGLGTAQTAVATGKTPMTYQDVPLQVNNTDFGGPNKALGAANNVFPYGGFPRLGDILQVTFVGGYKISPYGSPHSIIELNSLTMDSMMATAQDADIGDAKPYQPLATSAITAENIGRFCPIDHADAQSAGAAASGAGAIDDFNDSVVGITAASSPTPAIVAEYRYHWAMKLFDYLTVQSPQDDYTPNVDPWYADAGYGTGNTLFAYGAATYRYAGTTSAPLIPSPVANVIASVANAGLPNHFTTAQTEETAPVQGLINVNTAPWRVLATLPWRPASYSGYENLNATIAQGIAYYRDVDDGTVGAGTPTLPQHGHGPFKNLFELNEAIVEGTKLRDIFGNSSTKDFSLQDGNLSPLSATTSDGVVGDFEARFNVLTRVSNLITTRSDSYTAYILVQGWRNAETNNPTLVAQRRATIIIDRSAVTPVVTTPTVYNVPN